MDITERPIHCSDQKRLQFYVKDQDIWDKENSSEKLDSSIHRITKKQILQIKAWEDAHDAGKIPKNLPKYLDDIYNPDVKKRRKERRSRK
mgnify:CR=1 FL=1